MKTNTWNIHPGEVLREEFLKPLGMTTYRLAKALHVPLPRIHDIVLEKRSITADSALRLAKFFGTTPQFWMHLQDCYEIKKLSEDLSADLKAIMPIKNTSIAQISNI